MEYIVIGRFYSSVILSIPFLSKGTTKNPVGIENKQPTKKSESQITKKSDENPKRVAKIAKDITAVIVTETKKTNKIFAIFFDNFIII